ncbi:MAG: lipopolysaccharide transport periplasmic protein LptA [Candidatus Accumulibacter sp.]|jgi:lipopolysaccharide export system protein LptA|nr:lipopolysaccharide transport periplasmic protein LptA [Accumulibacter sp.]
MKTREILRAAAFLVACLACPAHAEKADRDKPISIEANRMSLDDINKVQIYEGNVVLTQGTTQLRTDRLVVTQDADGFQKGVATGGKDGLAHYKEKLEGKDACMEGKGERIEYNARNDQAEFFVRAWVKNASDEVRGYYILYNALTEKFTATNAPKGETARAAPPGAHPPRVRAIIMPKKTATEQENAATGADGIALKPSESVSLPRE